MKPLGVWEKELRRQARKDRRKARLPERRARRRARRAAVHREVWYKHHEAAEALGIDDEDVEILMQAGQVFYHKSYFSEHRLIPHREIKRLLRDARLNRIPA